jgi:hypothetical protein
MFWQALNKIGQRNYTQWLSGAVISYSDWKTGEPAAFATENCAVIQFEINESWWPVKY